MKWDVVLERIRGAIAGSPILFGLYGNRVRMAGPWSLERLPEMPLLEYSLVTDSESELWAPCVFQFDLFAREIDDNLTGERMLRRLFHQDLPIDLGGLVMWAQYNPNDGAILSTPDRDGFFGRALRFTFTPLRDKYQPVLPSS
jgi:hypothetical protein